MNMPSSQAQENTLVVNKVASSELSHQALPIVLIHGWGCDSKSWQPVLEALGQERDVYLVDLPGFGDNRSVMFDSPLALANSLAPLLPEKAHLVGWSLGAMFATSMAANFPQRFVSLFSISANAKFVESDDWSSACACDVYDNFLKGFDAETTTTLKRFIALQAQGDVNRRTVTQFLSTLRVEVEEDVKPAWSEGLRWLSLLDNRALLSSLVQPHFAVFGAHDHLVPVAVERDMVSCRMISQSLVVPDAGHAPHISSPELVVKNLKRFLLEVENLYHREKHRIAASFSRAANTYEKAASMQVEVARRLIDMKSDINGQVCDLGCGTGFCLNLLKDKTSELVGLDMAEGMLSHCKEKFAEHNIPLVCGDFDYLPLASNSVDGIVSSMSFQWSEAPEKLFKECRRVLSNQNKSDGWLLFSTLGPRSLYELRDAWKSVDKYVHVNSFIEGSALQQKLEDSGFVIEKTVAEDLVLQYGSAIDLMRDLKAIGAHNVNAGNNHGLSTRGQIQSVADAYEPMRKNGTLPATYEVLYFLARVAP